MSTKSPLTLLEIKKILPSDVDTVFKALTEVEFLNRWFYAMDTGSANCLVDLRPGGKYSMAMINQAGETVATPHGEFLEIDPPHQLSMTWITEGFVEYSILSFKLKPMGDKTELTLTHELPQAAVEPHRAGWATCLAHLQSMLNQLFNEH